MYRRTPKPHAGNLKGIDAVLLSHLHLDHYDPASLSLVATTATPIFGPEGAAASLRWHGYKEVHELRPGQSLRLGPVEVFGTEARHMGTRHPLARRTPALGFVISGSRDVYFAGDTGFFPGMADIWDDQLDVALLPIAGLGPRLPEFKHMSPRHAVAAMGLIRPSLVVPIHWGTYHLPGTTIIRMRRDVHRAAPFVFLRQAAVLEPQVRTVLLDPGAGMDLEAELAARSDAVARHAG